MLSLIIGILVLSCKTREFHNINIDNHPILDSLFYKVENISTYEDIYIIEVMRNDSIFKILSKNSLIMPSNLEREKIIIGKMYDIRLEPLFPVNPKILHSDVSGFIFKGTLIPLKMGDIYYKVSNIQGLFFYK